MPALGQTRAALAPDLPALGRPAPALAPPPDTGAVFVDEHGVLRWRTSGDEVALFGVNYTTPFAYAYRAHQRLGLSLKKAIDMDVAHMARLDLDAFRVHVWDREISDTSGNLLQNEHLDLFDYLLARLASRGIKTIITPIAWWGTGWPEPDEQTPGFSGRYSKQELMTSQRAREAQRKYLRQFVAHVNPYTKLSYLEDPSVIAVEIINEPNHPDDDRQTTEYINEMAGVLRDAGLKKPIFFNISENWSDRQALAVARAEIDGVSFQWYPTSLVHGRALTGNYLPNVTRYAIPEAGIQGLDRKAKMVYEFDAADVGGSYMYPAMARSFRAAGMQFAAMFSYDPVQIAWSNTEYPTHFVNLLYAPSKAISLMIAADAFRHIPRLKTFGDYPDNDSFQDFRVSYEEDLSEMNSATAFLYSNNTRTVPKDPRSLVRVAGVGKSAVVRYDGTGAYFLDRVGKGIWRLEVYPDVLWIRDPFEAPGMVRQAARLFWNERKIRIDLPDLGGTYAIRALNREGGTSKGRLLSEHLIRPGSYIVTSAAADRDEAERVSAPEGFLEDLYRPPAPTPGSIVNRSPEFALDATSPQFTFMIASEDSIESAALFTRRLGWRGFSRQELKPVGGFAYAVVDSPAAVQSGRIEYCVAVKTAKGTHTYPEGVKGMPSTWDFPGTRTWSMRVMSAGDPVMLLDAFRDRNKLVFSHGGRSLRYRRDFRNGPTGEGESVSIGVRFPGEEGVPFGMQANVGEALRPVSSMLGQYRSIVLTARTLTGALKDTSCVLGLNLMLSDGTCYGTRVRISGNWVEHRISLSAFQPVAPVNLPDTYPRFLPKFLDARPAPAGKPPDVRLLDRVQVVLDPADVPRQGDTREASFEIASVRLDP
jgi:hypothetical protein